MRRTVVAHNRAADSENRVHDPEFARRVGFRGGLVPGVDVFAYMASLPPAAWGEAWLGRGSLDARFLKPVYDGDRLDVEAEAANGDALQLTVTNRAGEVCATGLAERVHQEQTPDPDTWAPAPVPAPRVAADPHALAGLDRLGSIEEVVTAAAARTQLEEVREALPLFTERGLVHPGHLLRYADRLLMTSVQLPPWMHVSSRARFFDVLHVGETVTALANRQGLFDRKGHRFIQLDVLLIGPRGPVMRVDPYTAIYDPAWNRTSAES